MQQQVSFSPSLVNYNDSIVLPIIVGTGDNVCWAYLDQTFDTPHVLPLTNLHAPLTNLATSM